MTFQKMALASLFFANAAFAANPEGEPTGEKLKFSIEATVSVCKMKDAEHPAECRGDYEHSIKQELEVDVKRHYCSSGCENSSGTYGKTLTLRNPNTNGEMKVDFWLYVNRSDFPTRGTLTYTVEAHMRPTSGHRADDSMTMANVKNLEALNDVMVHSKAALVRDSANNLVELQPYVIVKNIRIEK